MTRSIVVSIGITRGKPFRKTAGSAISEELQDHHGREDEIRFPVHCPKRSGPDAHGNGPIRIWRRRRDAQTSSVGLAGNAINDRVTSGIETEIDREQAQPADTPMGGDMAITADQERDTTRHMFALAVIEAMGVCFACWDTSTTVVCFTGTGRPSSSGSILGLGTTTFTATGIPSETTTTRMFSPYIDDTYVASQETYDLPADVVTTGSPRSLG